MLSLSLNNRLKRAAHGLVLLAFLVPVAAVSCGKRKPPQPPAERVPQRAQINGRQIGDRIDLVWTMPARNVGPGSALNIDRVDIYRLAEPLGQPLSLTEQEFADRSTLIGSLQIDDSDFGLKRKVFSDKLTLVGQAARLRYAVRFVNSSGQKASFSNFFLIEPVANVAVAPGGFSISPSQEEIKLMWEVPPQNLDGSTPANILGYNLYRIDEAGSTSKLNEKPVEVTAFSDKKFEFGKKYGYFVRSVSLGRNAEEVESFGSETTFITPTDTFRPAPPEALTIAAAPANISIFFAFNLEPDIAGYRVFRSEDPGKAKQEWEELTSKPIESNTFQDKTARSGVVYYYYVVAVDRAGNVSDPSAIVSETAL